MAGQIEREGHGIFPSEFALFALKDGYQSETLSANVTLSDAYPSITKFDPNGAARDVTLDPEPTSAGMIRFVVNAADAAENLVIKNDAAATIATLNQNEAGLFYCDGTDWSLVCIFGIALS